MPLGITDRGDVGFEHDSTFSSAILIVTIGKKLQESYPFLLDEKVRKTQALDTFSKSSGIYTLVQYYHVFNCVNVLVGNDSLAMAKIQKL